MARNLCLTGQQYQELLRLASLPESEDTKRKRGQSDALSSYRAREVTRWLATDLSLSVTCNSGGYKHTPFWDLTQ